MGYHTVIDIMHNEDENITKIFDIDENSKLSAARIAALDVVSRVTNFSIYVKDIVDPILDQYRLEPSDRAFAYKLAVGVIQTFGTLDSLIVQCVKNPNDIEKDVMDCLRISTYEIVYLEKEAHAAVDQGVELVKLVKKQAKGLANLILHRVVKLAKDFPFANPDDNFEAFCRIYAVPLWLGERILQDCGEDYGKAMIASNNSRPNAYIFSNHVCANKDEVMHLLEENGAGPHDFLAVKNVALSSCIKIENPSALNSDNLQKALNEGKFIVCDAASQAIVESFILAAKTIKKNPSNMMEFCCGNGNKSIMFQSLCQRDLNYQLDYFCIDNNERKLNNLKNRMRKTHTRCTAALNIDASNYDELKNRIDFEFNGFSPEFDLVFVDAPCSGIGTMRRHPELKWFSHPDDISKLANLSLQILRNASHYVNPGGILAFSTCTITKEENQDNINKFLQTEEGSHFAIMKFSDIDGKRDYFDTKNITGMTDAHFLCLLQRIK